MKYLKLVILLLALMPLGNLLAQSGRSTGQTRASTITDTDTELTAETVDTTTDTTNPSIVYPQ